MKSNRDREVSPTRRGAAGTIVRTCITVAAPQATALVSVRAIALPDETGAPNRALALLERNGDGWRFVHAHLWVETCSVSGGPPGTPDEP